MVWCVFFRIALTDFKQSEKYKCCVSKYETSYDSFSFEVDIWIICETSLKYSEVIFNLATLLTDDEYVIYANHLDLYKGINNIVLLFVSYFRFNFYLSFEYSVFLMNLVTSFGSFLYSL